MDMISICADLQEELTALDAIVTPLPEPEWHTMTPAKGWTVRDQIVHLGGTDRVAAIAATDPERFNHEILVQDRAIRVARLQEKVRGMDHEALLTWWRTGYQAIIEILLSLHPKTRLPWFGPSMSAVSFATARLMETWAHGQDIVDALGVERVATRRLKHVAHIGVKARSFSFLAHGRQPPSEDVRVELLGPEGNLWFWGDERAENRIQGIALDFCLVVTKRRHVADTGLSIAGRTAREWLSIAQAFAGPPGAGRQPGQFVPRH